MLAASPSHPPLAVQRGLRALLMILAMVFAATTLTYTALWLFASHRADGPSAVELGFDIEYLADGHGARINSVVRSGPAERAGIRPGDRVVALDGRPMLGADLNQ